MLHVRHAAVRRSGAILATLAAAVWVTVGLVASVDPALRPAALVLLGMWWWTTGKMWAETGVLPRPLGVLTAALGALSLAGALAAAAVGDAAFRSVPLWPAIHAVVGAWLIALGLSLLRIVTDVPSR